MPIELEITVAVFSLLANIVTVCGVVSIVLLCRNLVKNTISNKSIEIGVRHEEHKDFARARKKLAFEIDIENHTDKFFTITKIIIEFSPLIKFVLYNKLSQIEKNSIVKNISLLGHEAKTVYGEIEMDEKVKIPNEIVIYLENTFSKLKFTKKLLSK